MSYVLPIPLFTRTHSLQHSSLSLTYLFSFWYNSIKLYFEAYIAATYLKAGLNKNGFYSGKS